MKIRSLTETLLYSNQGVINKFMTTEGLSKQNAEEIFTELKKWLWACARSISINGPKMIMPDAMEIIDRLWHTFILDTRAYAGFCNDHFGFFLHHNPAPTRLDKIVEINEGDYRKELENLLQFLSKNLGEDTLLNWFQRLPEKYGTTKIYHSQLK